MISDIVHVLVLSPTTNYQPLSDNMVYQKWKVLCVDGGDGRLDVRARAVESKEGGVV